MLAVLGNMFLPRISPTNLIQEPIDEVSGLPRVQACANNGESKAKI